MISGIDIYETGDCAHASIMKIIRKGRPCVHECLSDGYEIETYIDAQ